MVDRTIHERRCSLSGLRVPLRDVRALFSSIVCDPIGPLGLLVH